MTTNAPVPAEPSAKERFSWIAKNSKILIIALVVLIVAIAVSVFSFGLFTTSSANPGNTATSGIMEQGNSEAGAVLTASALLPGEEADGTVTISNIGDAAGDFTLTTSALTAESDVELATVLQLTVTADPALSTAGGASVFTGALADFANVEYDLGEWAADSEYTFTFTVSFPPGDASGSDNDYQDMAVEFDLTWDATQSTD